MIEYLDIGHVPYQNVLNLQHECLEKVKAKSDREFVILCSHPSIVTLGKKALPHEVEHWAGETIAVKRGGKATYHGPGQLVIYPIVDLNKRNRDVFKIVRGLEWACVEALKENHITAIGDPKNTGVWVEQHKVASIGLAVAHWITYHGMAINLEKDPMAFKGIRPCGMGQDVMTSIENILGYQLDRSHFTECFKKYFSQVLAPSELPLFL